MTADTYPESAGAGDARDPGWEQLDPELQNTVVAKAIAALGDPIRLRIVQLLAERDECSARELVAELPVSQPRVSVHLRCLLDCGFVTVRRDGRRAYYQLAGPHIAPLLATLREHAQSSLPGLLACLHCEPANAAGHDGAGTPDGCC